MTTRRLFLAGLGAIIAAPAIVRASSLMPVKAWRSGFLVLGMDFGSGDATAFLMVQQTQGGWVLLVEGFDVTSGKGDAPAVPDFDGHTMRWRVDGASLTLPAVAPPDSRLTIRRRTPFAMPEVSAS